MAWRWWQAVVAAVAAMAAMAASVGLAAGAQPPMPAPAPQRIVSLLPSATEAVCALGACERLVGVDDFSLDPPPVQALPRLGRTWEPSIEAVVHLRPDVVFTGRTPPVQQRLQALGLHVVEVDALTIADIESALRKIDKALQLHKAEIAIKNMRQELQEIASTAQARRPAAAP